MVSDNGRQFVSEEFGSFLKIAGVKYLKLAAPYHPPTNGQAERCVGTVKDVLQNMTSSPGSITTDINRFLQHYRVAPHSTTYQPPAQLFLGRKIRTRLDLVRPSTSYSQMFLSEKQKSSFVPSYREFQTSQLVYFLSGNPRMDKWITGKIITKLGDLHYEISYNGQRFKRHVYQLKPYYSNEGSINSPPTQNNTERKIRFF